MSVTTDREEWADVPSHLLPPREHWALVAQERAAMAADPPSARRTKLVHKRLLQEPSTDLGPPIKWATELRAFRELQYPAYYRQPFHSVPGGWLSKRAAMKNRMAMQAIYRDAHPASCLGLRFDLASLVPEKAAVVVDIGAGDGDGAAALAKTHPSAQVIAVEASPFMIVVGRRQNPDVHYLHALAEDTGLPTNCADAVTITLVLHECPRSAKEAILREGYRILKPGGLLVVADTPQSDLHTYRGFFEPYKEEWVDFDAVGMLGDLGFTAITHRGIFGGDGFVRSEKEVRNVTSETTDNRLFSVTARKRTSPL